MAKLNRRLRPPPQRASEDSSSSDSDIPADADITPRRLPPGPATRLRASLSRGFGASSAPNAASIAKRKRGDEVSSLRPGKRMRPDRPNQNLDDEDAPVDETVLGAFNSFAKSRAQPPTKDIVVALRSSKDDRARARGGLSSQKPIRSRRDAVEDTPQQQRSLRPSRATITVVGDEQDEEDEEEENTDADGGRDTGDEDTDENLVIRSDPRTASPELDTGMPKRAPGDVYDFPDDESEEEEPAVSNAPDQPRRVTINGLSTRKQGGVARPLTSETPLPSVEDSDFGYPVPAPAARSLRKRTPAQAASSRAPPSHSRIPSKGPPSIRGGGTVPGRRAGAVLGFIAEEPDEDGQGSGNEEAQEDEQQEDEQQYGDQGDDPQDEIHPSVSPTPSQRLAATVSGNAVKAMYKFMGKPGWSDKGEDWYKRLRAGMDANDAPGITRIGEQLFKYLYHLQLSLSKAPAASALELQGKWLEERTDAMKKPISEITKLFNQVRESRLAALGDSDRRDNSRLEVRRATVTDLTHHVMPMLVQALWRTCCLGGTQNFEGKTTLADELVFTPTSLPYARKITSWIRKLQETLEYEMEQRPVDYGDARKAERAKKNHRGFGTALGLWAEELQDAVDELEAQADAQNRIAECIRNDREIREAREVEEEEQLERTERKWAEVAESVKRISSQPRPLQEKWLKSIRALPPSSTAPASGVSRPPVVGFQEEPVVVEHEPWPNEDKKWLLDELRREDRKRGPMNQPSRDEIETWAETLGRDVDEVVQEIRLLKQAARMVAQQHGIMVAAWASTK
ncbi:hypothetical protein QBC47DRAFT_372932 [Echria macrotheca]|uniref:Uncharacterized protein n=1 Tax=Echria macrotheca TaxID=438768 RepID=A0AAJ0FG42_9PEZI|nr:hypothetical protein QBC47DRAFT_372932 [Echria macrotheca]